MSDVKLTEAQWREMIVAPHDLKEGLISDLHERGLIAPEPDKRKEAYQAFLDRMEPICAGMEMRFIFYAGFDAGQREAQPALTAEQVRQLVEANCEVVVTINSKPIHAALTNPPHAGEGV